MYVFIGEWLNVRDCRVGLQKLQGRFNLHDV